jgi:sugar phosphate permease
VTLPISGAAALALAMVVAAYVLSFFQRFAPAGIAPDLIAAFNTTASSLGVLAATYFYVYTVMQVPTGILVDTLGPRLILLLGGLVGRYREPAVRSGAQS